MNLETDLNNCTFCKIISGEIQGYVISENEKVIVFLSLENHPLVVSKQHIRDIYGLNEDIGSEIMKQLIKISKAVKNVFSCDGVYITQANEVAAGQGVFHLHFHVYPKWKNEVIKNPEIVNAQERSKTFDKFNNVLKNNSI